MKKGLCLIIMLSAVITMSCGSPSAHGTLNFYNWSDYISPEIIRQFEEEYGVKVQHHTYDLNEKMYTAIKEGSIAYDVCVPSDYMIEKMMREDMLEPLDYSSIPNAKYIKARFRSLPFDPEDRYSVPYMWGTLGIIYNTKLVKEPVHSWNILWDPQYAGKILMLDSPRDAFMVAQKRLGLAINDPDPEALEVAKQELLKQKPLLQAYANDNLEDIMIKGETALAVTWSGEAILMMKLNPDLAFTVPEEGTNLWFDSLVIPKGAPHKKEAERFIDFLCRPDIALKNALYIGYSTPNQGAYDMMNSTMKQNTVIYPDTSLLERCEVFEDLGEEYDTRLVKAWAEVTAH